MPKQGSFDLHLTFSGLYLVIVQGRVGDSEADAVHVLLPKIRHHQRRLSFSLGQLDYPKSHSRISNLAGGDGTRWGSVVLGSRVSIEPARQNGVELLWDSTTTTHSLRYALNVDQVGLELDEERVRAFKGTRFSIEAGTLFAADLYRNVSNGRPLTWLIGSDGRRVPTQSQYIADDVVLCLEDCTDLQVETGARRAGTLRFLPERRDFVRSRRDTVRLCLSNDLIDYRLCSPDRSTVVNFDRDGTFNHLGFLTALARHRSSICIPIPNSNGETPSGSQCNGLLACSDSNPFTLDTDPFP